MTDRELISKIPSKLHLYKGMHDAKLRKADILHMPFCTKLTIKSIESETTFNLATVNELPSKMFKYTTVFRFAPQINNKPIKIIEVLKKLPNLKVYCDIKMNLTMLKDTTFMSKVFRAAKRIQSYKHASHLMYACMYLLSTNPEQQNGDNPEIILIHVLESLRYLPLINNLMFTGRFYTKITNEQIISILHKYTHRLKFTSHGRRHIYFTADTRGITTQFEEHQSNFINRITSLSKGEWKVILRHTTLKLNSLFTPFQDNRNFRMTSAQLIITDKSLFLYQLITLWRWYEYIDKLEINISLKDIDELPESGLKSLDSLISSMKALNTIVLTIEQTEKAIPRKFLEDILCHSRIQNFKLYIVQRCTVSVVQEIVSELWAKIPQLRNLSICHHLSNCTMSKTKLFQNIKYLTQLKSLCIYETGMWANESALDREAMVEDVIRATRNMKFLEEIEIIHTESRDNLVSTSQNNFLRDLNPRIRKLSLNLPFSPNFIQSCSMLEKLCSFNNIRAVRLEGTLTIDKQLDFYENILKAIGYIKSLKSFRIDKSGLTIFLYWYKNVLASLRRKMDISIMQH
jgi:hypothetical protein